MVYANEIDSYAVQTYESNFKLKVDNRDIREVQTVPDFDILLAGFPCQPFSQAGFQKGFDDDRGNLYFELLRIIDMKNPKIIFLENVKNLTSHDKGNTFKVIYESLELRNYHIKYKVLNAKNYGIPQGRERIYIVAFLDIDAYNKFEFPKPIQELRPLSDFIDFESSDSSHYYYTPEKHKFYNELKNGVTAIGSIYQWRRKYVRDNKRGLCPTLTANMGDGGHTVPVITNGKDIRRLTPREFFNLQGFPKEYILPQLSRSQLYKQAGNSVVVDVVRLIAVNIMNCF